MVSFVEDPMLGESEATARKRITFKRAARWLIDIILPPRCLACGVELQEPATLCPKCWTNMRFIVPPFCDKTAIPFVIDPGPGIHAAIAYQYPPSWDRARAAALYDGAATALVHAFKYSDRHEVAPFLARAMVRAGTDILPQAHLILPIPLHPRRLWSRRFNQSVVLAKAIANAAQRPYDGDVLVRRKATDPQVGLSRDARARNMVGAFAVPEKKRNVISGKSIVVVDDVLTTGATLNAATRVLKRAGAASVDVLVFARVGQTVASG